MTNSFSGDILFSSTLTGNNITSAGQPFPHDVNFDGLAGAWTLNDALNAGNNIYINAGTLNTDGKTVQCKAIESVSTNARTLDLGTSNIIISAQNANGFIIDCNNFTLKADTSLITFTDNTGQTRALLFKTGLVTWIFMMLNLQAPLLQERFLQQHVILHSTRRPFQGLPILAAAVVFIPSMMMLL